ncbi:MAG: 23S rRNA (uracil(1939)-C(5))-methyltransferase RlmD [Clostridia bacterium]|nr:23S rRNA (uracil(1939)-C(5))-methyltransferase RlmD [Clostridia bacterium]
MSAPVKKNDEISITITGMSSEGFGIGRTEGFAVFVPYAIVGETVRAHIIKVASSYAVGKLIEVTEPSADRREPSCPVFSKCGGCALMHMSYEAQLEYKRNLVRDALERIGGLGGVSVSPVVGMDDPYRYRNKGSFPFAPKDGRAAWGLFAKKSHRLIGVYDCMIESSDAVNAAKAVADWANSFGVPAYDETSGAGVLRHVVTRSLTGGTSVCVVTTGKLPHKDELIGAIRLAVPNVTSIAQNINPNSTNVILGKVTRLLWGEETVSQTICGLDFGVSAESFLQVNPVQTEKLYSLAVEGLGLTKDMSVCDLYCGIGAITLMLAERAADAVGIEYVQKAVSDAKANAKLNGIYNAEFISGSAENVLPRLVKEGRRFDAVTLDPPRKGAEPEALKAAAECGACRIAYISCNPATLARDLKILAGYGFMIESVQPVDMFPHTAHIETVVQLTR